MDPAILDTQAVLYLAAGVIAAWSMTGHRARRPRLARPGRSPIEAPDAVLAASAVEDV